MKWYRGKKINKKRAQHRSQNALNNRHQPCALSWRPLMMIIYKKKSRVCVNFFTPKRQVLSSTCTKRRVFPTKKRERERQTSETHSFTKFYYCVFKKEEETNSLCFAPRHAQRCTIYSIWKSRKLLSCSCCAGPFRVIIDQLLSNSGFLISEIIR